MIIKQRTAFIKTHIKRSARIKDDLRNSKKRITFVKVTCRPEHYEVHPQPQTDW